MKKFFAPAIAVWLVTNAAAYAQLSGAPALGLDFGLLCKLFGDVTAFSAKAQMQVLDKNSKEKISTPFDLSVLDNKVRVEMDTSRMSNVSVPGAADALKQMGMDRVVTIIRPDKKANYMIFPGLQTYVNTPLPKEDVENFQSKPKIEKTAAGKETVAGHDCVKHNYVITDAGGQKREATVWEAADLKNLPAQVSTKEKNDTVIVRFKQIKTEKPDAKQFDVPAGYEEYRDVQEMVMAQMLKKASGSLSAPTPAQK